MGQKRITYKVTAKPNTTIDLVEMLRYSRDGEVRGMLDATWEEPKKGEGILGKAMEGNKDLYKFERMLEESR